jgi:hypothetical protein
MDTTVHYQKGYRGNDDGLLLGSSLGQIPTINIGLMTNSNNDKMQIGDNLIHIDNMNMTNLDVHTLLKEELFEIDDMFDDYEICNSNVSADSQQEQVPSQTYYDGHHTQGYLSESNKGYNDPDISIKAALDLIGTRIQSVLKKRKRYIKARVLADARSRINKFFRIFF